MSPSAVTPSYPRLPSPAALLLIKELEPLPPARIRQQAGSGHAHATYYPTARLRVPGEDLLEFRDRARRVADAHRFPDPLGGGSTAFDQELVRVVADLDLSPAEAAHDEVWNFISLVTAPDITFWRWPPDGETATARRAQLDRWLGGPRNVFRRLWWRAHILGVDSAGLLLEDEAVSIMERSFRGDRRVARRLAAHHVDQLPSTSDISRTELLRDAMKRLLRYNSFLTLDAMPDEGLDNLLREVFEASANALRTPLPEEVAALSPAERRSYLRRFGHRLRPPR